MRSNKGCHALIFALARLSCYYIITQFHTEMNCCLASLCCTSTMLRCLDTRKAYERYLVLGRLAVYSNNYYEDILKDIECVARSLYYLGRGSIAITTTTIL